MTVRTLLLAVAMFWVLAAAAGESEDRARLKALQDEIADTRARIESRSGRHARLSEKLEKQETAIADIGREMSTIENRMAQLRGELQSLDKRRTSLEEQRREQREQIAREIAMAYRLGREEPLKLLLNQQDPQQMARALKYYEYFLEARHAKIQAYRETLEELTEVANAIRSKQGNLAETRTELSERKTALERQHARRKETLAGLAEELGSEKDRLARLKKERAQLETVLAALEKAIQDLSPPESAPFPRQKGALPWPVKGRVKHAFGSRRAANLPWTGWLLETEPGQPVLSVHNGRVVFSDYLRGHGLVLIVDHGEGYLSLYAHNQVLLAEAGEWVEAGQAVARAGRSGGLTESALYFEIRHNGRPQDPKVWLADRR